MTWKLRKGPKASYKQTPSHHRPPKSRLTLNVTLANPTSIYPRLRPSRGWGRRVVLLKCHWLLTYCGQAHRSVLTPLLLLQHALFLAAKDIVVAGMTWNGTLRERWVLSLLIRWKPSHHHLPFIAPWENSGLRRTKEEIWQRPCVVNLNIGLVPAVKIERASSRLQLWSFLPTFLFTLSWQQPPGF